MRIFKTAWFIRFADAEGISDRALREASVRAERGLVDASLGGGLIKQRLARPGQGRSGGYRGLVALRVDERAVWMYGYSKQARADLRPDEVAQLRKLAKHLLALTEDELSALIARGDLKEVAARGPEVPK